MESSEDRTKAAGGAALAGYEYQIRVSIWLALDLILASQIASECVLEPADSQEDLEAQIVAAAHEDDPGPVATSTTLRTYRLIVQAKLRSAETWTPKGLERLLTHGGQIRKSAVELLRQVPSARYLLVTNAPLSGAAARLRVRNVAGAWPAASKLPAELARIPAVALRGRLAVISGEESDDLEGKIRAMLTTNFRVPNSRYSQCLQVLREMARARILGAGSGRWTRQDLEAVVREHEGYLASSPDLESYVFPTNWDDLQAAIHKRHAVLILGQSGTGKTQTSHKLQEELSKRLTGLTRVAIKRPKGPAEVVKDVTVPPVVFDIEDPWGKYEFDRNSRDWNDQLASIMSHARHDRLVIATSRRDVAQEAGVLPRLSAWIIDLESEHYDPPRRRALFRNRLDTLPPGLQVTTHKEESLVLSELATPLEIQKFFDALRSNDPNAETPARQIIYDAIRRAHQDSIESTVKEQIEAHDSVAAAAVIWGLLKTRDRLELQDLRRLEDVLGDLHPAIFPNGVTKLVNFFVTARNLRQPPGDPSVSYYHPRVEFGIEQTLTSHRVAARRSLTLLVDALLADVGEDPNWGIAIAVRMIESIARRPGELNPNVSPENQAKIDVWLDRQVMTLGSDLDSNLKLAAAAGSESSIVSEFARFVHHRAGTDFDSFNRWARPSVDAAWYDWMRASPSTEPLAKEYIRAVLPYERVEFPAEEFVDEMSRLSPNLTSAFIEAAEVTVHLGVNDAGEVICEGAIRNLDAFESIVDTAVGVLSAADASALEARGIRLAIENGEIAGDYAEETSDEGYSAQGYLRRYVHQTRSTRSWTWLWQHRHRNELLYYWINSLYHVPPSSITDEEVAAIFEAGYGSLQEGEVWALLRTHWHESFLPRLQSRVVQGGATREVQIEALHTLLQCASTALAAIIRSLKEGDLETRLIEVALEVADIPAYDGKPRWTQSLPSPYAQIGEAYCSAKSDATPTLSDELWRVIECSPPTNEIFRWFRVRLDRHRALPVVDDIRWLLTQADDVSRAVDALNGAVRHGLKDDVEAALEHRFSAVVARALHAIAEPLAAPLPTRLLELSSSEAAPVRRALALLLEQKPDVSNLAPLLALVRDTWSAEYRYDNHSASFPIARIAAKGLKKLLGMVATVEDELHSIAINTADLTLRLELFKLLAKSGAQHAQSQLFSLATTPGQDHIKIYAAHALLVARAAIPASIVHRITAELLRHEPAPVSIRLACLLAIKGAKEELLCAARELAKDRGALVLLVPMMQILSERNPTRADEIAQLLPLNHPVISWARSIPLAPMPPGMLIGLGNAILVDAVQHWFSPKK